MDQRYIFAVQCHNTHTWWPRPPTSSFWWIDSLQILFGIYWVLFIVVLIFDMGRHLHWFFWWFLVSCNVKCQEPLRVSYLAQAYLSKAILSLNSCMLKNLASILWFVPGNLGRILLAQAKNFWGPAKAGVGQKKPAFPMSVQPSPLWVMGRGGYLILLPTPHPSIPPPLTSPREAPPSATVVVSSIDLP
jgi:hypothetical protein